MKIFIVTQNAPMYLAGFLDDLLTRIGKTPHRVAGICVLSPFFKKSLMREIKERYNYYGPVDFFKMSVHIAKNKILSCVSRIVPSVGCHSVSNIIRRYRLHEVKTNSINSREFIDYIKANRIDLIISIASSQIFKTEILNAPVKGCINYHTALLPRYRGRQPLFWALLNGEKETGISIHEMDEKIDNGAIIVQRALPITPADTLHTIYLKTLGIGPELLAEAIRILGDDCKHRIANDASLATYNSFPSKEDAKLFRSRGKRFF